MGEVYRATDTRLDRTWRADGREILFVSEDLSVWGVPVETRGPRLQVGTPQKLFSTNMAITRTHQYAVNHDASRF